MNAQGGISNHNVINTRRNECARQGNECARRGWGRDAARHVATKMLGQPAPIRCEGGYTHMEATGGEIFAKTAKTPPLQSAFAGMLLRIASRSQCRYCRRLHTHTMPPMESHGYITVAVWEWRTLATFGVAPTENIISKPVNS